MTEYNIIVYSIAVGQVIIIALIFYAKIYVAERLKFAFTTDIEKYKSELNRQSMIEVENIKTNLA